MPIMETSKWKYTSDQKWATKEWGRNALIGLLVGGVLTQFNPSPLFQVFIDMAVIAGMVCGVVWIYKTFSNKT